MGPSEIVIIRARKGAPPVPCSLPQVYPFSAARFVSRPEPRIVDHLHVACALLARPESIALAVEALCRDEIAILGRTLMRRVGAAWPVRHPGGADGPAPPGSLQPRMPARTEVMALLLWRRSERRASMTRTTIMMPEDLKLRAQEAARELGISLAELIRETLERRLEGKPSDEDPLFKDVPVYEGAVPANLSEQHDRYLYGERGEGG